VTLYRDLHLKKYIISHKSLRYINHEVLQSRGRIVCYVPFINTVIGIVVLHMVHTLCGKRRKILIVEAAPRDFTPPLTFC
jgi:hypothetical protein